MYLNYIADLQYDNFFNKEDPYEHIFKNQFI